MIKNICSILLILSILYFCTDSKLKDELFKKYKFLILLAIIFLFLIQQNVEGFENPVCEQIKDEIPARLKSSYIGLLSRMDVCSEATEVSYENPVCEQIRNHRQVEQASHLRNLLSSVLDRIPGCSITDSDRVSDESCGNYINESIPQDGSEIPEWIQTSCEPLVTPLESQITELDTLNNELLSDNTSDSTRIQTLINQKEDLESEKEQLQSEKEQLLSEKNELEDEIEENRQQEDNRVIHCYGEWGECNTKCKKTYTVHTDKSNNGKDCKDDAGNIYTKSMSEEDRTVDCHRGEHKNCPKCKYEFFGLGCPKDDEDNVVGLNPID